MGVLHRVAQLADDDRDVLRGALAVLEAGLEQLGLGLEPVVLALEEGQPVCRCTGRPLPDGDLLAVGAMGVYGPVLAGWASNNKYSLIGAMRSGAQIVSYELSVGMSLVTIVVLAGTMQLSEIVQAQQYGWFIFKGHIPALIAFVIYIVASTAETNRGPFDLAEAESELTAGFHTEYSGIRFAFFFLAEYINMFIVAAIATTVFFGGWMPFNVYGWEGFNKVMNFIPPFIWFLGKTGALIFLIMWFKWTFPRLRIDQLLTLEWKYFLPINIVNVLIMALIVLLGWHW